MRQEFSSETTAIAGSADPALSRRGVLAGTAAALTLASVHPSAADTTAEMTVTEALRARRSVRAFLDRPVDPALLAELLWAAFGINRESAGLHTAPSWRGAADIAVHLASADGVQLYVPDGNRTQTRTTQDIRRMLSPQPFVATAPLCLIYISDLRRLSAAATEDERRTVAQIDAAVIAQNVYLFAAARGLGTCLVGGVDRPRVVEALNLSSHEFAVFAQPVGWPA